MRDTPTTYLPISEPRKHENAGMTMTHGRENTPLVLARQLHQTAANQGRSLTHAEEQTYDLAFAEAKGFAAGSAVVGIDRASLKPWRNGGEFLLAVRKAEISQRRNVDPRLSAQAAALGANETVEAEGGFFVPPQVSTKLIERTYDVGAVVSRCDTVPMGSSRLTVPIADESSRRDGHRYGGVTVARTMEAGTLANSVLLTENMELTATKMLGITVVTEELQDDLNALALNQWIKRAFPAEFSFQFDREALNGTGSRGVPGHQQFACDDRGEHRRWPGCCDSYDHQHHRHVSASLGTEPAASGLVRNTGGGRAAVAPAAHRGRLCGASLQLPGIQGQRFTLRKDVGLPRHSCRASEPAGSARGHRSCRHEPVSDRHSFQQVRHLHSCDVHPRAECLPLDRPERWLTHLESSSLAL